jgi:4-carboxymuconolactone decarboxylase
MTTADTVVLAMTASRPRPVARRRTTSAAAPAAAGVPGGPAAPLRLATHALCRYAAAMARGRDDAAAAALASARDAGARRRAAEEVALMLMLYAGYPAALEGLRVLNAAWPGHARRTIEGTPRQWSARGEKLCRSVYGPAYAKLIPAVRRLHPDLAQWMVEHGYGRVLGRRGLGVVERELVTVAALAALGWERQLVSHVLGAQRVGASAPAVGEALELGAAEGDERARAIAARTWERVVRLLAAAGGEGDSGAVGPAPLAAAARRSQAARARR